MSLFRSMIATNFSNSTPQSAKKVRGLLDLLALPFLFTCLFLTSLFITAVLSILHPATANAATLGSIKVTSALGQPFAAEIDISALEGDEFAQIQARIASPEIYEAAKLDYPSVVRLIRVSAERDSGGDGSGGSGNIRNSKAKLKLTSNTAINEPSINLLVEFTTGNGRLVQKYSVLLDLPKSGR